MKNINFKNSLIALLSIFLLINFGCARDIDELELATFPTNGDVYLDGFSGGLNYAAFGGSKVTAFDVDTEVKYQGTSSMKIAVPDEGDSEGAYAGGAYYTGTGRDLSGYDVLTFWAKATKAASIDVIGFGIDLEESRYETSIRGLTVNTNWKKYYIPIPDPSKLTEERGMLYYSEGPEDGKGYTFWIDEVKFEKLGTIAHAEPAILEGQEQVIPAEVGDELPIGGTYTIFNLPTGVNQRVETAPSYFDFLSSDTSIGTVSSYGVVSVIDSGSVVIIAKLAGIDAAGSLTVGSRGDAVRPLAPAPTPTESPDSVISLFSNAYTNVTVDTWNPFWEFSTALNFDLQIGGDDVKQYKFLNFVGIEFKAQTIDASDMTHFHIDVWTPDPTDFPASFKVLLVDFGPDGVVEGDDNSSHEVSFTSPILSSNQWVSLDIPLANFTGLSSRKQLGQLVLSGEVPNVFIDNVYFYKSGETVVTPTGPTTAAPTPNRDASKVISIFSDAYSNQASNLNPDWGQATSVSEESIAGNNTLVYKGLNYQGLELGSSLDVSGMNFLHLDYWSANSTTLNTFLISDGPVETPYALPTPTSGWNSVDIPLGDFSPVDLAALIQFKFEGNGDIYFDNIYFYTNEGGTGGGDKPTTAAPTPIRDAANVASIFSDAYANLPIENYNPDWGQATVVTEEMIGGNNTLVYTGLNYQGLQLNGSQDVSSMTNLHIDYWTKNSTALDVFLISNGPVETPYTLPVPTSGWNSIDISLSDFSPVDLADLIQFKFEGNGDIYLDNIYFYKDGGGTGGGDAPTVAAPEPTHAAGDVIAIFSDAYDIAPIEDYNPNWGQATITTEQSVGGSNTLVYKGLNYQGLQLDGSQDVSGMGFLHLDFWTANSTALNVFLISPGPTETPYALSVPTSGWRSVDIPLSEFSPVDLADVFQFKFEGNGDIYLDNIYFHK